MPEKPDPSGARSARPPAKPLVAITPEGFERLRGAYRPGAPPRPVPPPPAEPLPEYPGQVSFPFDPLPRKVRADPELMPLDKLVYWGLVSLLFGPSRECSSTNAKIRSRIGGETIVEAYTDAAGKPRRRQVVTSGPSDDTLARCFRRLEGRGYIVRIADPSVLAGRRILLPPVDGI